MPGQRVKIQHAKPSSISQTVPSKKHHSHGRVVEENGFSTQLDLFHLFITWSSFLASSQDLQPGTLLDLLDDWSSCFNRSAVGRLGRDFSGAGEEIFLREADSSRKMSSDSLPRTSRNFHRKTSINQDSEVDLSGSI